MMSDSLGKKMVAKYLERRQDIVYLDDGTRWRVARYNVAALEGWRMFDPVEIGGLPNASLIINVRRAQMLRADRLETGQE